MHRTSNRLRGRTAAFVAGLLGAVLMTGTVAGAGAPERFGPFVQEYSFVGFSCDGFDIMIEGAGTDEFTIWFDDTGEVARVLYRARYPHDTLTNLTTGASIVVRGEFQETIVRDPGTGDFTKSITGFRYLVNEPGTGITVRDVGRISYGDLEQTIVTWQAGKHDLALDAQIWEAFCAALG
jgi:hypothetical protein